ncbi:serine aminopeptidase domain-containing protein [Chitinophaga varians]|uniref:serine aminopeptidase domain-containing protein n=1 Tax=Chitinophaga varians TaxID=2202339 RepID=UPI00165F363A|nr:alpha/beta hydrolase [Chitinophaga varians]MBC9911941.1 alpha/beta hydrolase [Chitinophaga varians]
MKKICLLTTLLLPFLKMTAQVDYLAAAAKVQRYYNRQQADSLYGMFGNTIKSMLPPDQTRTMLSQLQNQLGNMMQLTPTGGDGTYQTWKADFAKGTLTMILALNANHQMEGFRFVPYQEKKATETTADNYNLTTADATIHGTLTLPVSNGPVPVVLLIAGSGPTDRDGNNNMGLKTNVYKMLAETLQAAGIACVRYDKRGVGASATGKPETDISFEGTVNDAAGFINMLKADKRFSRVIVAGHSEGSMIGMLAIQRSPADQFISIAGAGEPIDVILERQLNAQSPPLAAKAKSMLDSLKQGHTVVNTEPALQGLFYPAVQPYIMSWVKYDPEKEIGKLKIPILIIQGNTDAQVSVNDAQHLKQGAPAAQLKIIDQMNHVLKVAPASGGINDITYADPTKPLSAALVKDVESFIKSR